MPPAPWTTGTRALGAGLTVAVTVGLFVAAGIWLDSTLDTGAVFSVVLALLGFAGGMLHLIGVMVPEALPWGRRKRSSDSEGGGGGGSESEDDGTPR